MKRSKKIFLIISGIFFLIIIFIGIDISRRTTFPGSKNYWSKEKEERDSINSPISPDSVSVDQK